MKKILITVCGICAFGLSDCMNDKYISPSVSAQNINLSETLQEKAAKTLESLHEICWVCINDRGLLVSDDVRQAMCDYEYKIMTRVVCDFNFMKESYYGLLDLITENIKKDLSCDVQVEALRMMKWILNCCDNVWDKNVSKMFGNFELFQEIYGRMFVIEAKKADACVISGNRVDLAKNDYLSTKLNPYRCNGDYVDAMRKYDECKSEAIYLAQKLSDMQKTINYFAVDSYMDIVKEIASLISCDLISGLVDNGVIKRDSINSIRGEDGFILESELNTFDSFVDYVDALTSKFVDSVLANICSPIFDASVTRVYDNKEYVLHESILKKYDSETYAEYCQRVNYERSWFGIAPGELIAPVVRPMMTLADFCAGKKSW